MKKVNLNALKPGMITAEPVMTKTGQCILEKGTALNLQRIMRLSFYNIEYVNVEDENKSKKPAEPQEEVSAPVAAVAAQKVRSTQQFQTFQIDHSFVLTSIRTSFENYVNNGIAPDTEALLASTIELFDSCTTTIELFDMLHNMRCYGDSVYAHSLNVALICRRIGMWLKFEDSDLNTLTLCGLFHDIGKLKIPEELLNKPDKYTDEEFELVKKHPKFSYDLLKTLPLDKHIKMSALSHHERCDGSGYPTGLTQDETDDYAMIVSIADVYDAMTAARSYRAPLCPFQVIANFEQDGLQKYKPKYILTFLSHIANTYQNNRILLSDRRIAKIVMLNQKSLSRPIIQLDDGSCLDLTTDYSIYIKSVL